MNTRTIEILSPVGSPEALTAAVRCGAAAVYFGVGGCNARRAAHAFSAEELRQAVRYCHARGTAVHLTLNTLLRDDELSGALAIARLACESGVDALIVQDVGLARLIHAAAPTMPLHASTQLSCHTPAGVRFLHEAGFSRVVLAREMTREEIAACVGLGAEIEVFVHGALCMSVSGQCYFSAMLGGRSGNRGTCAQTCRLPFMPTEDTPRPCPADRAALSLKDNCLIDYVAELKALGVTSLKIEGRLKRPEYVAAATAVYTAAARGETVPAEELDRLQRVFSRSGFTDGYYTDRRGGTMFGTRRKEDVTAAAGVLDTLRHTYDNEQPRVGVRLDFSADAQACRLTAEDADGHRVTMTDAPAEVALTRPLDRERVIVQLQKTGGTPFFATATEATVADGMTLPLSRINAMRRAALEQLEDARSAITPIPFDPAALPSPAPALAAPAPTRTIIRLASWEQWSPALTADLVILPLAVDPAHITSLTASGQPVGVEIPRGLFGTEDSVRAALRTAKAAGAVAALCGNVGALPLAKEAGLTAVGGFGLNITNLHALSFYRERGLDEAVLSMELTFPQMRALKDAPLPTGILLYGRQPLMLTRNCPRRCAGASCRDCHGQGLTDRTGCVFPVVCAGGCHEVLNSVPLWWADHLDEVPQTAFRLLHFTTETAAEAAAVVDAYRTGAPAPAGITRGLYRRGVE